MPYCERHDRSFGSWHAYQQHVDNHPGHNVCNVCDRDFAAWESLKQHWIASPRHSYCQRCEEHFDDDEDLEEHYHEAHDYCAPCRQFFVNDFGLKEHYRQSPRHHYCDSCNRLFLSDANLRSHQNSSIHRPKDVVCPFRGCDMAFVSRAALVLHLESGNCGSGMDRKTVNRYVRKYDTQNIITDPSRLITGTSSADITYSANERSWNGYAYECYLCNATFSNLHGLNQHLNSPRHADKVYVCRGRNCGLRFNALSGLFQHIESEKCGVSKFKSVQSTMDSVLGRMGRLTL